MAKKRISNTTLDASLRELFPKFVASQTAKGVSEKTIKTYHSHFHSLEKHIDLSMRIRSLTKEDLGNMVVSMRQSGLAFGRQRCRYTVSRHENKDCFFLRQHDKI